jgi:nucleoside phosphorylase
MHYILVVGIGGGIPNEKDVRLGDVVIGTEVIQHDFGKATTKGFLPTKVPKSPPRVFIAAMNELLSVRVRTMLDSSHTCPSSKISIFASLDATGLMSYLKQNTSTSMGGLIVWIVIKNLL